LPCAVPSPPALDAGRGASVFGLPFPDLMFRRKTVHRMNFDPATGGRFPRCSRSRPAADRRLRLLTRKARATTNGRGGRKVMSRGLGAGERRPPKRGASRYARGRLGVAQGSHLIRVFAPWWRAARRSGSRPALPWHAHAAQAERLKPPGSLLHHNLDTRWSITARSSQRGPSGSTRHARTCAAMPASWLLRRNRRQGRERGGSDRPDASWRAWAVSIRKACRSHMLVRVAGTRSPAARRSTRSTRAPSAAARIAMPRSVVRLLGRTPRT